MEKYVKFVKFKNMETLKMMLALVFFLMTGINAKATSDKTSMESKSQNDSYMPFLADGKSWLVGTPDGKVYGYYVDGETTIGSRLCKKVMERRIVPQGDNSSYHCAIYEEDGKVWLFRSGMTEPELLYDFKAEAGDVVMKHDETWYEGRVVYTIDHVDYINVDGRKFKRQFVNDEQGQLVDVWVEGVGGSSLFGRGLRDSWLMLSCLMDGEEVFLKSYFTCPDEEPAPYHRLLAVGKKWNQSYTDVCTPEGDYTFDFEIKGDTTICGVRHYKLYAHNYENKGGEKMLGLLVESNKRVYSLWTGLPNMDYQTLLYDFGAEAGERLGFISSWNVRTIVRNEIQHDGGTLRRQAMGYEPWAGLSSWNPINHPLDWWVEGIGSSTHFVKPYIWTPARQYRLESCTLDGDTLFTFEDFQIPEDAVPEMREVDYHPMLAKGKSWLYHFTQGHADMETGGFWQTAYDVTYTLRGDTIIDGREYIKMYEEYEDKCNYHSAWREDGRKIYAAYPGRPDSLCYDYGLPYLGQAPYTWHSEIHESIYLAAKDVVKAGGSYHNRFWFIDDNYQEGRFWVDGVGCMNGLLYPDHPNNYYTPYWDFISCTTPEGETVTRDDIYGEAVPYEEVFPPEDIHLSCPDDNHPHTIDLGLPSGTKWACCNVGATTPEGYGGYYAWGETEEKDIYDWSTYIHCDGNDDTLHDIGSNIASTQYDVAHVQWGGNWQMPSRKQFQELFDNCAYLWTTKNNISGGQFTGPSGNTIFLPSTGIRLVDDLYYDNTYGFYWLSERMPIISAWGHVWNPGVAFVLGVSSSESSGGTFEYYSGITIRPVIIGTTKINLPKPSEVNPVIAVYNLYGIKVADNLEQAGNLSPGIYIVNGKKIVIK